MNSLAVRKAQEASAALRGKAKVEYVDADIKKAVEDHAEEAGGSHGSGEESGTGRCGARSRRGPWRSSGRRPGSGNAAGTDALIG